MANEGNLIPFNERTESEQRQIAQKGGIASGAARRRKRSMKEAADYYLSLPETDRRRVNALLRDEVDMRTSTIRCRWSWALLKPPSAVMPGPPGCC